MGHEFTLVHPDGHADLKMASAIVGDPLLYLIGTLLFRRVITGQLPKIQITALAALIAVFFAAGYLTPALLSLVTTLVLVVVALAEKGAAHFPDPPDHR